MILPAKFCFQQYIFCATRVNSGRRVVHCDKLKCTQMRSVRRHQPKSLIRDFIMQQQLTLNNDQLDYLASRIAAQVASTMTTATPDEWLVAQQAAEVLKVSISKLESMTRENVVPSHKLGRTRRYKRSELLALSSATTPLSPKEPPAAAKQQTGGPTVPSNLSELHAMFRRPYAMAIDTMHIADSKWKFFSHGLVLSLLDIKSDPDGSKSVTALHNHYQSKSAQCSETTGTAENVSPAEPQPAADDDAQS